MFGWLEDHWKGIVTVAASIVVGVAVTAAIIATAPVSLPALLVTTAAVAAGGFAGGVTGYYLGHWLNGQETSVKQAAIEGTIGAVVSVATLGLGRGLAPVVSRAVSPVVSEVAAPAVTRAVSFTTAGTITGAANQVVSNARNDRPLTENVASAAVTNALLGGALSTTAEVALPRLLGQTPPVAEAPSRTRGITGALDGLPETSSELPPTKEASLGSSVTERPPTRAPRPPSKLAEAPLEGPDPLLGARPSASELAAALERAKAGTPRPGDAELIVQNTVADVRQVLFKDKPASYDQGGACGFSSCLTARQLANIPGAKVSVYQAADAFGGQGSFRHAFTVVEVDGKRFLVDATFRQFFNSKYTNPNQIGYPGTVMRQTAQGSAIADELLAKGYTELTDDVAREYARALSSGENTGFKAADFDGRGTWDPQDEYYDFELDPILEKAGVEPAPGPR